MDDNTWTFPPQYQPSVAKNIITGEQGSIVVSTINRQSSTMFSYGDWYAETMVFSLKDDGSLNKILDQSESCVDSLTVHERMVEKWTDILKENK